MKTIIFITPGPTFSPHSESYQSQYIRLSRYFRGYIWTTSSQSFSFNIQNFHFNSMKSNFTFWANFRFAKFCIWNAIQLTKSHTKVDLVTTYDPLKTGLIGLAVSRLLCTKFAPEVNGVYTSPAEWLDLPNSLLNRAKQKLYPKIMGFVLRRADGIRLLFDGQIAPFERICNDKIIRAFHCFVPTSQFRNIKEEKEILFVGFPFRRKGVDILIKAFKQIAPKYPDWKLKILGWFPDPTQLNNAIGLHPQIYHHPPVHYHEMPEHIGKCAILVLPSRSEAMGRVLAEAMAAGKPRIGSNVDGIPTVISHGVDGLLVEPENVDDLARKLDLLMGDKELREKLGKAGAKRAKEEFTEDIYIRNVIEFYNEVMGS